MFEWLESIKFSPRYECLKTGDFGLLEEFKRRVKEMILDYSSVKGNGQLDLR